MKPKNSYISKQNFIELIECPRDAMQGWKQWIPTEQKIAYLKALMGVGFGVIDCGSFVSPKAIPQMADTAEVLSAIQKENSLSKLLVIVANERGALDAARFDVIDYFGFPLSVSETFQQRNTNASILEGVKRVEAIKKIADTAHKKMVVYLSMGFGNPYGDPYSPDLLVQYSQLLKNMGIEVISLADTVGVATSEAIQLALQTLIPEFPTVQIGVHLHASATQQHTKLYAAINAGCTRFDGAIKGIGGCPMAQNDLVGNMDSLFIVETLVEKGMALKIDTKQLAYCTSLAENIFI